MSIITDHKKWKKDHRQWLTTQKKLRLGHKKMLRNINNFENAISNRVAEIQQLAKSIKKHEKMMSKGRGKKHSSAMHQKFKNAHRKQNLRHQLHLRAHRDLLEVDKKIQNAIKKFRRI